MKSDNNERFENEQNENFWNKSFIVGFWETIFRVLSTISIFSLIRKIDIINKNGVHIFKSYRFVDSWALSNLIMSLISPMILYYLDIKYKVVFYIIGMYSIERIFEIIVYQVNVLLFDGYRKRKEDNSYEIYSVTRMVISLLQNYVEIIFWYSTIIITTIKLFSELSISLGDIIISGILCMITYNMDIVSKVNDSLGSVISNIIFFEIICGFLMTLISLSRFIGLLPSVKERDRR